MSNEIIMAPIKPTRYTILSSNGIVFFFSYSQYLTHVGLDVPKTPLKLLTPMQNTTVSFTDNSRH